MMEAIKCCNLPAHSKEFTNQACIAFSTFSISISPVNHFEIVILCPLVSVQYVGSD